MSENNILSESASAESSDSNESILRTCRTAPGDRPERYETSAQPDRTVQWMSHDEWLKQDLFLRLSRSSFRSRFHLSDKDKEYVRKKGMDTIESHAHDFIKKRLAPAVIQNDGKQTPMHGHPVFIAQHATGCCCRGCLLKWHGIMPGHELTEEEQQYIVNVIMEWIKRQMQV